MTEITRQASIRIEKYTKVDGAEGPLRQIIARVPAQTGVYEDRLGNELTIEVGPIDSNNNQKVIFGGESIPTRKQRGKPGQFRQVENPRRVVVFPYSGYEQVMQQVSATEQLVFTRFGAPSAGD